MVFFYDRFFFTTQARFLSEKFYFVCVGGDPLGGHPQEGSPKHGRIPSKINGRKKKPRSFPGFFLRPRSDMWVA